MGEFDLIARYFTRPVRHAALGVGDDCALLAPRPGMQLAISSDMLVEGRHFFADVDPEALGHKALAVNLSDLAACGARPLAFTLALALPRVDEAWLAGFSKGLLALADAHGCELVGGDTTQGPLNICITVFGEVPAGQALLRSGARAGDVIYVSGTLGDARLALEALLGHIHLPGELLAQARQRLERHLGRAGNRAEVEEHDIGELANGGFVAMRLTLHVYAETRAVADDAARQRGHRLDMHAVAARKIHTAQHARRAA